VLSLSDAAAALHSSLLAVGLLLASVSGDRLDRLVGGRRSQLAACLLLLAAGALIVSSLAFPLTLTGAGLVGYGTDVLLAHLDRTETRGGGTLARVRMSRAAFVAMLATLSVPLAIGLGEAIGLGWQLAFVVPAITIGVALWWWRPRVSDALEQDDSSRGVNKTATDVPFEPNVPPSAMLGRRLVRSRSPRRIVPPDQYVSYAPSGSETSPGPGRSSVLCSPPVRTCARGARRGKMPLPERPRSGCRAAIPTIAIDYPHGGGRATSRARPRRTGPARRAAPAPARWH